MTSKNNVKNENPDKFVTERQMKYITGELWFPLSEDLLNWDYDFHKLMLNDQIRMVAYEKAIKEAIKPGMKVVDIGTGTGILAKWALDAGADIVYGIELNEKIIPHALNRIKEAGYSDKYKVFNDISFNVNLPEKVDIIISEILGNVGDNEDMTPIIEDIRKRFLKDSGRILPSSVKVFLCPVSVTLLNEDIKNKNYKRLNKNYDLDSILHKQKTVNPFNLYYDAIIPLNSYISKPELVRDFKFDGGDESEYEVNVKFIVDRDSVFTGFKGYFIARLSDDVVLDISGDNIEERETADCWKHCYLPIEKTIKVKVGDIISLKYRRVYPVNKSIFRQCYSWEGDVKRGSGLVSIFNQAMS